MKKKKKSFVCLLLFFICLLYGFIPCMAALQQEDVLEQLTEEMDFEEMDALLKEYGNEFSFSELFEIMQTDGFCKELAEKMFLWVKNALVGEIKTNRILLTEVVILALCFSVLKNFAGAFQSAYISDLCFLLVYCVMALMLLKAFGSLQEIVGGAVSDCAEFMKAFVPAFCISMVFASNVSSSIGFYQTAFLVIYLVEWLFLNVLMPMIHIYVLLEVFSHFMPEERFSNFTELFFSLIQWGMKMAGIAVFGLNAVQNLIAPAKDRMGQGILTKTASALPGIGNVLNGMTEILFSCGLLIKNCVGAAGLAAFLLIALIPLVKAVCLALFYKLAAAVTEPVTDKRICGCLKGLADGGFLYVKLLGYCVMLFFVTIALAAATGT